MIIRTSGGHSVFFDDFFLFTNGENGTLYNIKPATDGNRDNNGKPDNGEPVIKPDETPVIKPEEPANDNSNNSSTEMKKGTKKNTGARDYNRCRCVTGSCFRGNIIGYRPQKEKGKEK